MEEAKLNSEGEQKCNTMCSELCESCRDRTRCVFVFSYTLVVFTITQEVITATAQFSCTRRQRSFCNNPGMLYVHVSQLWFKASAMKKKRQGWDLNPRVQSVVKASAKKKKSDKDGIRTHACRAQWISSPSP